MSAERATGPANFPISSLQVSVCRSSGMFSEPNSTFGKNASNPNLPLVYALVCLTSPVYAFSFITAGATHQTTPTASSERYRSAVNGAKYKRHCVRRHPVQDTDAPRKSEVIIIMETAARETHAA